MFSLMSKWRSIVELLAPARKVVRIEADAPPEHMPARHLVLLTEGSEEWSVVMLCPCGCGDNVELPLFAEARPRWHLRTDARGRATLHPSIWRKDGCRSHFFVRAGRVSWVN